MTAHSGLMGRGSAFAVKFVARHQAKPDETVRRLPKSASGFVTRGRFVGKAGGQGQKVSVWVSYKKAGFSDASKYRKSLRTNAAYITRDGGIEAVDEKGNRLGLDDIHDKTSAWDDDARYYKIVISPEHGQMMDLEAFTASTMEKARDDLLTDDERQRGVDLEWVMAQHHDTDHPHVHVMLRAKVDGKDLRLSGGYFCHGMERRAEEVATGMLGYRLGQEVSAVERQQALESKRTELGLDPETGRAPVADSDEAATGKHKSASRDTRSFDGGIE